MSLIIEMITFTSLSHVGLFPSNTRPLGGKHDPQAGKFPSLTRCCRRSLRRVALASSTKTDDVVTGNGKLSTLDLVSTNQ